MGEAGGRVGQLPGGGLSAAVAADGDGAALPCRVGSDPLTPAGQGMAEDTPSRTRKPTPLWN